MIIFNAIALIFSLFCRGLQLKYHDTQAKGNSLLIKGIVALGKVPSNTGKVRHNTTLQPT